MIGTRLNVSLLAAAGIAWLTLVSDAIGAPSDGEKLAQQSCAECHAIKPGQKSANEKAPPFAEVAARRETTEPSLKVFLRTPHANMPNLMLKADEINDLVDYIIALKPKP